jgi:hypothetical protein
VKSLGYPIEVEAHDDDKAVAGCPYGWESKDVRTFLLPYDD